jgi:1-phosphofructokinase
VGRVAVFAPHPLLTITVERRGGGDDVHLHAGGQGVWVCRMASELGAEPVLCGFAGGETGDVLRALLAPLPGEERLVATRARTGCYVVDRRNGERNLLGAALAEAPSRHELDDLLSETCTAAIASDTLVVCNPYPGDGLPLESYSLVVADARENGVPVIADLSTPRLDAALEARPDVVKLNDWELAEYVAGPVDGPARRRAAAERGSSRRHASAAAPERVAATP